MSLQRANLALVNGGFSVDNHSLWSYIYATDSLATITTALYFADVAAEEVVREGDIFFIKGSDGNAIYQASVVTTSDITLVPMSSDEWKVVSSALTPTTSTWNLNLPTGAFQLAGASINTSGTLTNVAYLGATAQSFTGTNTFTTIPPQLNATSHAAIDSDYDVVDKSYVDALNVAYAEATVTVTTEELLALAAAPKTLVAAPGAGKYIKFLGADLILDYNSAAYVEGGYNAVIRYTDGSGVIVSEAIETTGFLDQTADTITNAIPKKDAIVDAAGCVDKALVLDNSGGGEWITGDSPIDVVIRYKVVTSGL